MTIATVALIASRYRGVLPSEEPEYNSTPLAPARMEKLSRLGRYGSGGATRCGLRADRVSQMGMRVLRGTALPADQGAYGFAITDCGCLAQGRSPVYGGGFAFGSGV